jgi:hypothetical protein
MRRGRPCKCDQAHKRCIARERRRRRRRRELAKHKRRLIGGRDHRLKDDRSSRTDSAPSRRRSPQQLTEEADHFQGAALLLINNLTNESRQPVHNNWRCSAVHQNSARLRIEEIVQKQCTHRIARRLREKNKGFRA